MFRFALDPHVQAVGIGIYIVSLPISFCPPIPMQNITVVSKRQKIITKPDGLTSRPGRFPN